MESSDTQSDPGATGGAIALVEISRLNVERHNVSTVLDKLLTFSDSLEHVNQFRNSLLFSFSGYAGDRREVYEIPEVVAYFRKLTDHWPYWYHFIEKKAGSMSTVFQLLCDTEVVTRQGGKAASGWKHPAQVPKAMQRLFDGLNALYESYGISELENEAMSIVVLDVIDQSVLKIR